MPKLKYQVLSNHTFAALSLTTCIVLPVFSSIAVSQELEQDEIIIYGQKYSRQRALEQKREASVVMDVMTTDDLGRLPDKNAAESINRLPGVSVLVEKGEGRYAAIRGIKPDWNAVTINGFDVGSPEKEDSGRQVALDVLGGEMLSTVQVIKVRTPDMDGQGIGGVVNLIPKRPLDSGERFTGNTQVRYGFLEYDQRSPYYDNDDPYSLETHLMGKANESLGWIVGLSKTDNQYLAQGIYQDTWRVVDSASGLSLPERTKNNYYVIGRERNTYNIGLDWRLSSNTRLLAQLFQTEFNEFQHRNRFEQIISQDGSDIVSRSGNRLTLAQGATGVTANLRREDADKSVSSFMLSGETLAEDWTFTYGASLGKTELEEPNSDWRFDETNMGIGPDTLILGGSGIVTVLEGGTVAHNDPANFDFGQVRYQNDKTDQDLASINFDVETQVPFHSNEATLKFGVKLSRNDKTLNFQQDRFSGNFNLAAVQGLSAGSFFNNVDGADRVNVWMSLNGLNNYFNNNPGLFNASGSNVDRDLSGDRNIDEEITAYYGMATIDFGETLSLIVGARFEQTDVSSVANQNTDAGFRRVKVDGNSDVLLPTLAATYNITDDFLVRAAWSKSVGRPDLADLSATSSFGIDANNIGQLNIGNPDLEPRESTNLDLSFEWYFANYSLVSLAWFDKDVDNEIITKTQVINTGLFQGVDYGVNTLNVNTKINADKAEIDGLELSLQHQFEWLPEPFNGLGFSASWTKLDASFFDSDLNANRALEDQPEESQSYTLFYQYGPLDLALTYNYNEAFLTDLEDFTDASDDLYQGEFGRFDLRASYRFSDSLTLFFEGVNLNNEPTSEFQGGRKSQNTEFEYVGSTYYLGANYQF